MAKAKPLPEAPRRPTSPAGRLLCWLWYDRSVRWQLLLAFAVITFCASALAATILVIDARNRAIAEMTGTMQIAEHFIQELVDKVADKPAAARLPQKLVAELGHLRHVDITVIDENGSSETINPSDKPPDLSRLETGGDDRQALEELHGRRAADVFVKLIGVATKTREVPVIVDRKRVATVVITGRPQDEIAEAWTGLATMAMIWLFTNISMIAALYVIFGRILKPLTDVADGMRDLELGDSKVRIDTPRVRELRDIAHSFNHMAESLDTVTAENKALLHQLLGVQEQERRRIAGDLHDEVGPCLFGIMSNMSSIKRSVDALPEAQAQAIGKRIGNIKDICERLKLMNRNLLNRLYPMAAGRVTIAELIARLIAEFESRHPDADVTMRHADLADSYGEELDLLIYRTVQEGVSNALRHAQAGRIVVELERKDEPNPRDRCTGRAMLEITVSDDGIGIAAETQPGFGLKTMRERAKARGGTFAIARREPSGTRLSVRVPLDDEEKKTRDNNKRESDRGNAL